jgi:hypothetical protein
VGVIKDTGPYFDFGGIEWSQFRVFLCPCRADVFARSGRSKIAHLPEPAAVSFTVVQCRLRLTQTKLEYVRAKWAKLRHHRRPLTVAWLRLRWTTTPKHALACVYGSTTAVSVARGGPRCAQQSPCTIMHHGVQHQPPSLHPSCRSRRTLRW